MIRTPPPCAALLVVVVVVATLASGAGRAHDRASVLRVLAAASSKGPDLSAPTIDHTPVTSMPRSGALTITADIDDESGIFEPTLLIRKRGDATYMRVPMARAHPSDPGSIRYAALVPASLGAGPLEYFIEAFDEQGNGPGLSGAEDAPMVIMPGNGSAPMDDLLGGGPADAPAVGGVVPNPPLGGIEPPANRDDTPLWIGLGVASAVAAIGAGVGIGLLVAGTPPPAVDLVRLQVTASGPIAGTGP